MDTTSFRISLHSPQTHQISMETIPLQKIGLGTPVAFGAAKLTINTSENWAQKTTYIPSRGEIVVYSDRNIIDQICYPGIKIGDGLAYVVDLPFTGDDIAYDILNRLRAHVNNNEIHLNSGERESWNSKVSCNIDGETLIFERND